MLLVWTAAVWRIQSNMQCRPKCAGMHPFEVCAMPARMLGKGTNSANYPLQRARHTSVERAASIGALF